MRRLLTALGLSLGLCGSLRAAPVGGPAGNFILNVSTNPNLPAFSVTSGTVSGQLSLPFITSGQCITGQGANPITGVACGGGSGSGGIAFTTGTSAGFSTTISSPTTVGLFNGFQVIVTQQGGSTAYFLLNASSVTLQGNTVSLSGLVLSTTSLGSSISNLVLSTTSLALNFPVGLSTNTVGVLPVLNGGTGQTSPGLIAGTNILSITGTWPNQTINAATQNSNSIYSATSTASFPFGLSASTIQVNGQGNGKVSLVINQSTFTATSSSVTIVVGNLAVFTSTNGTLGNGGQGGGTPSGNPFDVQMSSANGTQFAGYDNFTNNGGTVSIQQAANASVKSYPKVAFTGYSSFAVKGVTTTFDASSPITSASSMTMTAVSLTNLTGTQCLHETNGAVTGTGSDCGSGGGGGGGSALAIGTGTTSGYTGAIVSSPTKIALFDNGIFSSKGLDAANTTNFISTLAMSGDITTLASSLVTTAQSTQNNIHTLGGPVTISSLTVASAETLTGGLTVDSQTITEVNGGSFNINGSSGININGGKLTMTSPVAASNASTDTLVATMSNSNFVNSTLKYTRSAAGGLVITSSGPFTGGTGATLELDNSGQRTLPCSGNGGILLNSWCVTTSSANFPGTSMDTAGGLTETYGISIGSMSGAGLTSCSGASNALTWNSGTNLFGCNTIASGNGGQGSFFNIDIATGGQSGFASPPTSSQTVRAGIVFDSTTFNGKLTDATTIFITVNSSSVTLQGPIVSSITPNTVYPGAVASGIYGNITGLGTQGQALNMGTHQINSVTDPSVAQDAATKNYVDTQILGVDYKAPVRLGTTAALPANTYLNGSSGVGATLTGVSFGALNIDNTTPIVGDRVLISNEATTANNGIYTVTTVGAVATLYVLTRATDYNQTSEVQAGDAVFVTSGSVNNNTGWVQTTSGTITMGASPIVFIQFTGLGDVKAGYGISTTGNTINLRSDATSYIQNSNTAVAGSTASVSFLYASSSASIVGPISATTATFSGQIIAGNLSSTSTITGSLVLNNGFYLSTATKSGAAGIINGNYTTGCLDSVILSSGLSHVGNLITLGAAANCPNQVIQITKVNASIDVTSITVTAPDLMFGTTGMFLLNAVGDTCELISGGSSGWWAHGHGCDATPPFLVAAPIDNGTPGFTASSDTIVCPFYIPVPVSIIGFRFIMQATGGTNQSQFNLAILDQVGNIIQSTGPITTTATGIQTKLWNTLNLPAGMYYMADQGSTTGMTFTGGAAGSAAHALCSKKAATSMTMPNPFGFPGTATSNYHTITILVNGGRLTE